MVDLDPAQPTLIEETADGWQVRRGGAREALIRFRDRDDAVRFASGLIHAVGGGELIIRAHDGRVDTLLLADADLDRPDEAPPQRTSGTPHVTSRGGQVRLVDHRRGSHPAAQTRRSPVRPPRA